jgi:hypothetical protein
MYPAMNATSAPPTSFHPTPLRRDPIRRARAASSLACALALSLSLGACRCNSPTVGGPSLPAPTSQTTAAHNVNSALPVVRDPTRIPGTYLLNERTIARDAGR